MSFAVRSELDDLRERVKKLEEAARRTRRGRTNQRGAAQSRDSRGRASGPLGAALDRLLGDKP
jgi:hypothetical protein